MNRLLLLALPALLTACQKPEASAPAPATTPASTPATTTTEAATPAPATDAAGAAPVAKVEFAYPGTIRAAGKLPKYQWRLTSATDAKGQALDALMPRAELPVTLEFSGSKLAVSNTCNRMNGGYTIGGKAIVIDKLASTMMACADPKLMALDQALGKRLQGKLGLRLSTGDASKLELTNAAGDVLVFDSTPTSATRYGSAGERVFLEVAAQTKACSHPLIAGKQCLQVRELKYDAKGLKVGTPGPFGHFYNTIEGYTHEPGVRNVLRVNRYAIKNPPADAPSQAYVLDMVVESANEGR